MSLSKAQRARLGVFLITGVFLLAVLIIVPVGFKLSDKNKYYYSSFEGESLSGLEEGARVKYHGVPVGKVGDVSYDPGNIERVIVKYEIDYDFPMKKDMFVQTGLVGITGLKYVEILGGTNDSRPLEEGGELPVKESLMSNLTGKADVIINKIEILLNHINTFTHPDSLASVKKTFDNVADITSEVGFLVKDIRPDVKDIVSSAKTTVRNINMITADVQSFTGDINQNVKGKDLAGLISRIDSTVSTMQNLSRNLDLTIMQSREDFSISIKNLKEAMENANQLTRVLAENPSLLIKGTNQKERPVR